MNQAYNYTKKLWTGLEEGKVPPLQHHWFTPQLLMVWLHRTQLAVLICVKHCNKFNVKYYKYLWFVCRNNRKQNILLDCLWTTDLVMFTTLKIGQDWWIKYESDIACKTRSESSTEILNPFISQGIGENFPFSLHWCLLNHCSRKCLLPGEKRQKRPPVQGCWIRKWYLLC